MRPSAGMRSLAVSFPATVRDNGYFREKYPEIVADAESRALARLWARSNKAPRNLFEVEMQPYLGDAFRGAVERRVLAPGERVLDMETRAARDALAAAGLEPGDIDLIITASFLPDQVGVGNAPRLAAALGADCAAWNLETACSGSVVGFQTAAGLVRGGDYRHVLVVVSCSYSRQADERDTMSWFLGDGAGAFVVGQVDEGFGYLGGHSVHTAPTCDTFSYQIDIDDRTEEPRVHMVASERTGRVLSETATGYVRTCCQAAVKAAGVSLADIDFFIFHTPVPWFAPFAARVLEVDSARTICTNRWFSNVGPVLMPANLHHAARLGKVQHGDLVLLQSIGSVSSAGAAVMRWSAPPLGPPPAGLE